MNIVIDIGENLAGVILMIAFVCMLVAALKW